GGCSSIALAMGSGQVFGMVVLLKTCELSADSVVARNKIYNYYASICLSNGISPLSAASYLE
ncbi:hypothetical protein, partial [Klebsiella aerogenes]|uniref:hypothetical protein n=1 Tax=Klebsiella aerogenes TaxID=548 RepID=UPI0019546BE9